MFPDIQSKFPLKALLAAENWRCELVKGGKAVPSIPLEKPGDGDVFGETSSVFLPTAALLNPVQLGGGLKSSSSSIYLAFPLGFRVL